MKKVYILIVSVVISALVLSACGSGPGTDEKPVDPTQAPVIIIQAETTSKVIIWNPCLQGENLDLQIEPLVENGEVVPNAFMGLDLNRSEVNSGLKYSTSLPGSAYIHFFNAHDGLTRDARGPGSVESTAYTVWCKAGNHRSELAGKYQIMDAQSIPDYLDFEPHPLPFTIK